MRTTGLALIAAAVLIGAWLLKTGGSSPPYSETEYTRSILEHIRTFVEERYDTRSAPKTSPELRKLVDDGLLNEQGLTDRWGQPLNVRCVDASCRRLAIYSHGPNRQDENGSGDDVAVEAKLRGE